MTPTDKDTSVRSAAFGRRSLRPRVCVADSKPRNRTFPIDVLEDIGSVTVECTDTSEMRTLLKVQTFSLIVLESSTDDIEIDKILQTLAAIQFEGKVLPIAVPSSILAFAIQERARDLGIDTYLRCQRR